MGGGYSSCSPLDADTHRILMSETLLKYSNATIACMSNSDRTILTLATTLDRHLEEMGMGRKELIKLACALLDHAMRRVATQENHTP